MDAEGKLGRPLGFLNVFPYCFCRDISILICFSSKVSKSQSRKLVELKSSKKATNASDFTSSHNTLQTTVNGSESILGCFVPWGLMCIC